MPEVQFDSFSEFLAMGKYGFYVWVSYGVFAVVLAWNIVQPLWYRRRLERQLRARSRRESAVQARMHVNTNSGE